MNPLYTFLPPKAIPFWENFPKNRRFPSGGGADAGGCAAMAARTRGGCAQRWRRGCGGMRSGGGADAGGDAQRWRRGRTGAPPAAARHARHPHAARHARHPHAARHAHHPPRPAVPVIRRGPPCPSSTRGTPYPSSDVPAMPVIHRRPPCPSSAAARHARHPHAARHAHHPPRPAVRRPVCANEKSPVRGGRSFSDVARARAHTRRAGREKFFRCCAGAYAPPAGASGSVTSPIFSMRSSLTAVRPLRSA